ncbi:MAG: hypothetical protein MI920_01915, partial [Kiloniellales bacterium]|nr:hypothetical protein [Kiloniellales bacterium]
MSLATFKASHTCHLTRDYKNIVASSVEPTAIFGQRRRSAQRPVRPKTANYPQPFLLITNATEGLVEHTAERRAGIESLGKLPEQPFSLRLNAASSTQCSVSPARL